MARAKRRMFSMDDEFFEVLRRESFERREPMSKILRDSFFFKFGRRKRK